MDTTGRETGERRDGSRASVCCSLCAFVRFRSFESPRCFVLWRPARAAPAPRKKGGKSSAGTEKRRVGEGEGVERKGRRARRCLTKLRGIKFAFYCARFLDASSTRRGPSWKAPVHRRDGYLARPIEGRGRGGGSNSPISFRDMDTTYAI